MSILCWKLCVDVEGGKDTLDSVLGSLVFGMLLETHPIAYRKPPPLDAPNICVGVAYICGGNATGEFI